MVCNTIQGLIQIATNVLFRPKEPSPVIYSGPVKVSEIKHCDNMAKSNVILLKSVQLLLMHQGKVIDKFTKVSVYKVIHW